MKPEILFRILFYRFLNYIKNYDYRRIGRFLKYYFTGIYRRADQDHLFLFAAGLAFSLLICIMPFVLLLISLLGNLLANDSISDQLRSFIDTVIPYSGYADFVKSIISNRIEEIKNYRSVAGYVGLVGLLFATSGFFATLRTVLNRAYDVAESRHFVIGKLRDFGMILLIAFGFLLAAIIIPPWESLINAIPTTEKIPFIDRDILQNVLGLLSSPVLLFLLFFVFYNFIPYDRMNKKVVAVSAFWATLLWSLAEMLFGYFLVNFASFKRIYGTYVFIIVVVFWIYYSSIVFLLGAHIGQLYKLRKTDITP